MKPPSARVLIARAIDAIEAEQLGEPAHKAAIVVRAWRTSPERFGLEFHPQHPDSNRVIMELVKHKNLFQSKGTCLYVLTDEGRELARR